MRFKGVTGALAIAVLSALPACHSAKSQSSQINYLTQGDYDCYHYDASKIAAMESLPSGFLSGFTGSTHDTALQRLAGIPPRDLNYLVWSYQQGMFRGISAAGSLGGAAGVTTFTHGRTPSGTQGSVARSVSTTPSNTGFALQHEIGHAVEIIIREGAQSTAYSDFDSAIGQLRDEFVTKGSRIRSYAKSDDHEAFAEAYAQFYCSPESHQFITDNLPYASSFLTTVLLPPVWATNAATNVAAQPSAPSPSDASNVIASPTGQTGTDVNASADNWLSRLLAQFKGSTAQVSDSLPTQTAGAAPKAEPDIAVALQGEVDANHVLGIAFASAVSIEKIAICLEGETICLGKTQLTDADKTLTMDVTRTLSGRNFYPTTLVTSEQLKLFTQSWLLLGYDKQNKLLSHRKIGFK